MAEGKANRARPPRAYVFRCKAIKLPPGTKSYGKLPRGDEMFVEPSYLKWWLLGGSAVTIALAAGILIGRFILR
jgi:hypothetical protein